MHFGGITDLSGAGVAHRLAQTFYLLVERRRTNISFHCGFGVVWCSGTGVGELDLEQSGGS